MRALLALVLVLAMPAGAIERSAAAVREFRSMHACPATGLRSGPCRGWEVDHSIPLCAGGLDRPENMVWLRKDDHAFKTRIDVRECAKLRRAAARPAQ